MSLICQKHPGSWIFLNGPGYCQECARERTAPCPSDATACSPSYFTFRNKDGQTIQLRGDLTMEDLIRMGYTDIRLVQPEKPLAPHEWRADPISPENSKL